MWHKTKNGTLVNLGRVFTIRLDDHQGWAVVAHMDRDGPPVPLLIGTREECEAEMARIEERVMGPNQAYVQMSWREKCRCFIVEGYGCGCVRED